MNEETNNPFEVVGDQPLEARVVAWVLGEASAFEAEELARLCKETPELEVFRRRIEAVHGLVEQDVLLPVDDVDRLECRKVVGSHRRPPWSRGRVGFAESLSHRASARLRGRGKRLPAAERVSAASRAFRWRDRT